MKKRILPLVIFSVLILSCKTDKKTPQSIDHQKTDSIPLSATKKIDTYTSLTAPILGIDVSHFQGDVKWNDIKRDGVDYAYIKASEGGTFKDPMFKTNRSLTKKNNIFSGAYHFYVAGNDPIKQAQNFIAAVEKLEPGDLPPVLDLEQGGIKGSINKEAYSKNTLKWLQYVEKELGITPIIYCSPTFGNNYLNSPEFANYKLWLAEYTKHTPIVPNTWTKTGWTFWQRTDLKNIKGINGDVDYDLFNGNAKDFLKLVKQ